jgi:uncharacterized protein
MRESEQRLLFRTHYRSSEATAGLGGSTFYCCGSPRYITRMNREAVISKLKSIRLALEAEGVSHIAMFGSRARGDFKPESDLDIILDVDPERKFSILGLVRVERITSEAVGIPANAVMRRSLDPTFMDTIRPDIVEVF